MARVFIDGFETGTMDMWDITTNCSLVSPSSYGMTGSYCLALSDADSIMIKTLPSAAEYYVSFLFYSTGGDGRGLMLLFLYGSAELIRLEISNNQFIVIRGPSAGGTTIATGPYMSSDVLYHIQARIKISETVGVVQVKFDDVLGVDYSGDTSYSGETIITAIRMNSNGPLYGGVYRRYDDFVVDNSTWPGVTKICALVPDATGASTQWTTSVSTPNWECVNEIPASDTDYVVTNDPDMIDTYSFTNLPGNVSVIKTVSVRARIKKESYGSPSKINAIVRTNSTNFLSNTLTLPTVLQGRAGMWETNPASTGVPWDVTTVNSMQAGIKTLA